MADILIETRRGWLEADRAAFLDSVHGAVSATLPPGATGPIIRLLEYDEDCFAPPVPGRSAFTRIEIAFAVSGRENEDADLRRAVLAAVEGFGLTAMDVRIVLLPLPPQTAG